MISQTVIYRPYGLNLNAADIIVALALRHLSGIPRTELRVGKAIASDRVVNISNGRVIKTTTWATAADKEAYFAHPQLIQYVKEVLHGWKLEGDPDGPESAKAFIKHILSGSQTRKWVRDLSVPDSEVFWGGESIILFEWEL